MHEDDAAAGAGADGGHFGVPVKAGDIVEDGCTGGEGGAGGGGFVGVNGEDGGGASLEDAFDDREEAGLFLVGGDERGGGVAGVGAGAGAFCAEVEDICAGVEEVEGVGDGGVGVEVEAAVGEGVRSDIEDGHDEGSLAEGQGAVGELPGGGLAEVGHGWRLPFHRTFQLGEIEDWWRESSHGVGRIQGSPR